MERKAEIKTIRGMKVVVYPMESVEAVRVEMVIESGSAREIGDKWGAFHLLEHMLHQGTEKLGTNLEIELYKEKYGLTSDAYTNNNTIGIGIKCPHYSLASAFDLLNQLAFKPVLDDSSLKKEQEVIKNEYRDKWDNPYTRFGQAQMEQLFGKNHPYVRDGMGSPDFVSGLKIADLTKLHKKFFVGKNIYLGVAGKVSTTDVFDLVDKTLEFDSGKELEPLFLPSLDGKRELYWQEEMKQERVVLAWITPGFKHQNLTERMTMGISRYLLGGGMQSILNQELRQKRGLAYRAWAADWVYAELGCFSTGIQIEPKNRVETLELMRKLVYDFAKNGVEENKLTQAINFMNAMTTINFDSVSNIANDLVNQLHSFGEVYFPEDYIETSKIIDNKLLIKMMSESISPEKEFVSIMGNEKKQI